MTGQQELLAKAYAAFNARDIDAALAMMRVDVDWPNGLEGGRVYGHSGVRSYWQRQWTMINPRVEPAEFATDPSGRTVVEVHQLVRDLSGHILSDEMVHHVYSFRDSLIQRMDIEKTKNKKDEGSRMKILLIGGTGLTGPSAASQLHESGHSVTVFHRGKTPAPDGAEQMIGEHQHLSDYRAEFERRKFDVVVDFIATSEPQARQLMDTLRGITGRVVALSSGDVYRAMGVFRGTESGPLQELPLTEDSDLRTKPQYSPEELKAFPQILPYADENYEKIAVEKCVLGDRELPGTVLRLPMVYGPGDYVHRFHYLLKRMDDGRATIIFSDDVAAWRTPRGYAENVGAAIALAATSQRAAGRIYNICEPEAFSELEWAKKIAKAVNWKGEFVVLPRDKAPKHLQYPSRAEQHLDASSVRIREELGYKEAISTEEGIRRTIPWERANPPQQIYFAPFDYEAEDAAIKELRATA